MTTYIQRNEMTTNNSVARLPRVSTVVAGSGVVLGVLLIVLSLPLLVMAGLWLVGMALALVGYALVSYRQFDMAVWDTAIIGQGLGLLGMALLFGAALLA